MINQYLNENNHPATVNTIIITICSITTITAIITIITITITITIIITFKLTDCDTLPSL